MWVGSICIISYEVSQSSLSGPSETYSNIPITACRHKCFRVVVRPKYSNYRNGNANVNCSMAGELPMYQFPILPCQLYPRAFALYILYARVSMPSPCPTCVYHSSSPSLTPVSLVDSYPPAQSLICFPKIRIYESIAQACPECSTRASHSHVVGTNWSSNSPGAFWESRPFHRADSTQR